jgi:hypothetical protein
MDDNTISSTGSYGTIETYSGGLAIRNPGKFNYRLRRRGTGALLAEICVFY